MTAALERVIAEQQARIDRLETAAHLHAQGWAKHHAKLEQFMNDAIAFVNYHKDAEKWPSVESDFRESIMRMGWCMECECNPCECDHD